MAERLPAPVINAGRRLVNLLPAALGERVRALWRATGARRRAAETQRLRRLFDTIGASGIDEPDINHLLHFLRGQALGQLPQGAGEFVSVGCAGTWYFLWVNEKCAPRRHTGIEFYAPRPNDLPANARWIANTAGNMEAAGDASADILFSGQNLEHLWPGDVANFLLESHRVLKPGGLLVVDSPNRRITARLNWSHPEHTIEFEPAEARELLTLAGFDVTRTLGLWLCETPAGELLPFSGMTDTGPWPLQRRIAAAANDPERSFIWWIEARRADRGPDEARLRERIAQIHAIAWPERLNRLLTSIGKPVERDGGTWFDSEGRAGALTFGPYTALPPGRHELTMTVEYPEGVKPGAATGSLHVSGGPEHAILARIDLAGGAAGERIDVTLPFALPDTTFQVQFVVTAPSRTRMLARKAARLGTAPDL